MLLEMPCCNRVGFIAGGNLLQDAKFDDTCFLIEKRGFGVTNLTIPEPASKGGVLPRLDTAEREPPTRATLRETEALSEFPAVLVR